MEGHVVKLDAARAHIRHGLWHGGISHGVGRIQKLDQALGRARGTLNLAPNLAERGCRAGDHHRVDDKLNKLANAGRARTYIPSADPENHRDAAKDHEDDDRGHHGAGDDTVQGGDKAALGHVVEPD